MKLALLCTLELDFDVRLDQLRTPHRDGGIYGTGSGVLVGDRLSGRIRWTNHPRIRADGTTLPDMHGVIDVGHGSTVVVQMSGVSMLLADGPHAWLNHELCVCEGAYDAARETGIFAIHQCVSDLD
jgi:hypothetical protein